MQQIDLRTVFTTASGIRVDLLRPEAAQIRRDDVAEGLAKINRFSGSTPDVTYSVAQHSVVGAYAVLRETDDELAAAYFLLHDGHEYLVGDSTTPKKNADVELAREHFGEQGAAIVREVQRIGNYRLDVALHEAASLAFPVPTNLAAIVKKFDLVMRDTEWRDLVPFPEPWPYDRETRPLREAIYPWPWQLAKAAFLEACDRFLPGFE